ncbi:MAG: hypothetical protein Q4F97_12105, partial [Bacteroidales bacterium]|nr:hypothetical protein [Bacteroidales bacterium]
YMAEGQIYKLRTPITVKIPIGTIDTTARVLNVARVGGKLLGFVGSVMTFGDILHDVGSGNYTDATGRTVIALAQYGFAFIPGYGWAISLGIGIVGQMIYD